MAKKAGIEESFQELDKIVAALEGGELSLEESFKQYNAGMKLIQSCNEAIDKVEKKLIVLEEEE